MTRAKARAPLMVTTPQGEDYFLKLVARGTHKVVMTAYVAGGDTKNFLAPLGSYDVYYEQGKVWCGSIKEFGQNVRLMKLEGAFDFTDTGTSYSGITLKLGTPDGNLLSTEVSDAEFSLLEPAEASSSAGR
jgi:hypothetical protein